MFHLKRHNDSVYDSNPNILTETISDKMIDCGTSVGGKQITENELLNKPILEDRSNGAQKSHISNACGKIIPTKTTYYQALFACMPRIIHGSFILVFLLLPVITN